MQRTEPAGLERLQAPLLRTGAKQSQSHADLFQWPLGQLQALPAVREPDVQTCRNMQRQSMSRRDVSLAQTTASTRVWLSTVRAKSPLDASTAPSAGAKK